MTERPELLDFSGSYQIGDWVHCLHCERYYRVGEFRKIDGLQYCPYPDCSGDAVIDVFGKWTGEGEPERGKVYPVNP